MTLNRVVLSLALALSGPATLAAEFLPEAASVSGYGPTRVGYSMWYSGACGERVGALVNHSGHATIDEALQSVLQYSRDSAKHIVARCPAVQTIEVGAHGHASSPPRFYRFVMHRSDNWMPTQLALNSSIIDALIADDYLPISSPGNLGSAAFMKLDSGRLDVVYGKTFESRMVATHFEKKMFEDVEPPRLNHYTVRGHWYELGSEQPGDRCDNSREGYPLWGSFSMTFSPWDNNMRTQRKRCADHNETAKSEPGAIGNIRIHDFKNYGLEPFKIAAVLAEKVESAGRFAAAPSASDFANTRQPLYSSGNIRLYASRPELCSHLDFDAVYRVNHENRDSQFGGSYRNFIGPLLKRVASEHCDQPLTASVDSYRVGDTGKWDHMTFQFRPIQPSAWGGDEDYLELLDHFKGEGAKAHDAWLAANVLGPSCSDGPFCSLPGGRYLNAIYRGDLNSIRQMDHLHAESLKAFARAQVPGGGQANPISDLFNAVIDAEEIQLLRDSANKYLYSYAAWGESCLNAGAQAKTFQYTTPVVIETDEWGVTTRSGGDVYEATYTLNTEFFGLRDQIGGAYGARDSDNPWNLPSMTQVYKGIVEMKRSYDCRSPEVKQFEKQLLALTNAVLAEPGTIPPTANNRPPGFEKSVAEPFAPLAAAAPQAPSTIAIGAPARLPSVVAPQVVRTQAPTTPAAAPPAAQSPQPAPATDTRGTPVTSASVARMSPMERQQKMSAEMQVAHQAIRDEMAELNQSVQQAIRSATDPNARTKILADYQAKLAEIQRKMQTETQRIQQKYQ